MIGLRVPAAIAYRHLAIRLVQHRLQDGPGCPRVTHADPQRVPHPPPILTLASTDGDFEAEVVSAFGEAFNNIAVHGFGGLTPEPVHVEVDWDEDKLVITCVDTGRVFDPDAVALPDTGRAPRARHGPLHHAELHGPDRLPPRSPQRAADGEAPISSVTLGDTPRPPRRDAPIPTQRRSQRRPSCRAPESARRPSCRAPESARRPSCRAPESARRPSCRAPESARRPSCRAPESARRPSCRAPESARRRRRRGSRLGGRFDPAPRELYRGHPRVDGPEDGGARGEDET